ncbi:MAG: DUF4878 domain-containing protein [bacterium]
MKKLVYLFAVMAVVFTFAACGGGSSNSPKAVAEEYMSYSEKGNFDKVMKITYYSENVSDDDKKQIAEMAKSMYESQPETVAESYTFVEEVISEDGQTATVKFDKVLVSGKEKTETVKLILIDGKWMIDGGK